MDPSSPADRCVLWRSRVLPMPAELADALGKRGLAYTQVSDAYAAIAEVCVRARANPGRSGCVLLLVEPTSLARVEAVLDAIERHAPGVSCWAYSKGSKPELRAITRSDVSTPRVDAPPVPEPISRASRPSLRLTSDNYEPRTPDPDAGAVRIANAGAPAEDAGSEGSDSTKGTNLLTEEELAMLLGERPPRALG